MFDRFYILVTSTFNASPRTRLRDICFLFKDPISPIPSARPSLEPPPESIYLGEVDYPDIDRLPNQTPDGRSATASDLSLFR